MNTNSHNSSFTREMLNRLEANIASGALEVRHGGRLVRYQSIAEMIKARDLIRDELAKQEANGRRRSRIVRLYQIGKGV